MRHPSSAVHQEDAAQALALPWGGNDKYESTGSRASLRNIARLLGGSALSRAHDIRSAVGGIDDRHGAPPAVAALLLEQSDNLLRGDRAWTRTPPPALALPG